MSITILTLCLFLAPTLFAAKGGGKGKPPTEPPPDEETPCETSVEKEPAIVYLTATEKTGPRKDFVYTRDLMFASADGCHTTMLIEHAAQWLPDTKKNEGKDRFIVNVSGVRLVTYGNHGVVSWYNTYQQPWTLEYLEFDFDSEGNIFLPLDGQQSYSSSIGYLIVEQDIRILENGDLLAVTLEKKDNEDPRRIVVVNLTTGNEQVLSSGVCHYTDPLGNCYKPRYGNLIWDPIGQMFYVDLTYIPEGLGYQKTIVRYEFEQTIGWSGPQPIVTTIGADPFQQDLTINGVSLDGLISYTFLQDLPNNGAERLAGILDPENCISVICNGVDGVIEGADYFGAWTAEDTILSKDNENLVEYPDPFSSSDTRILIRNIHSFDSDL
jgi:hypothetical protein